MKTKICGLNPTRDVQLCIDLRVNYLGFVFYKKSPRNINYEDIKILSNYDKKDSAFVAVTVNPSDEFIKKNLIGNFDFIQLHGSETKDRVTEIKNMGFKIIKAIKVKDVQDIDKYREFDNADIILFDTPGMEKSFEFPENLITKLPIGTKYALAGSISKDNVENINKLGVNFFDLSSSLESQLGYKDHHKIKNFINKINELKN
ncbi:phosphoribosylanthranilate isomerase [Candidatus Pelagibacter bacterium]|jgi:phosphoribosylanthranilate isomerase|nr:phosphoribosylanthranilate isomerase [Candidatus Pelagibacter bacterium]